MFIRDLRVFAEAFDGTLHHYRDKTGLECNAVIHLRDGSYALITGGVTFCPAIQKYQGLYR
jgi:uncharacterized protein